MKKVMLIGMLLLMAMGRETSAATIIKPPVIAISGYTQLGYIRNDSTSNATFSDATADDGFKLMKARLTFKAEIDPRVALNLQIDAAARTGATDATVKNMLTDAYFDTKFVKDHVIRLGQYKLPFGLENPIPDSRTWPIDASVVKGALINTRDIGVDISSKHPEYEYHAGVVNGPGANKNDDNSKKDFYASAQYVYQNRLTAGLSGIVQMNAHTQTVVDAFVLAKPNWGELHFEYMDAKDRYASTKKKGWYAMAVPGLNPRTWVVARYETYDPGASTANNEVSRTTAGILYTTSKYSRLKVNYEWRKDKAARKSGDVFTIMWQVEY